MSVPSGAGKPATREPYQLSINNLPGVAGASASFSFPALPAGKRVVIETASLRVSLPPYQTAQAVLGANVFQGAPTLAVGQLFFTLTRRGIFGGSDILTASQPTRLYGSGPTPLTFAVVRDSTSGTFAFELSVSGYLEADAPWPV
jgi:hypothetical protein